jgi:C-terminal processing protease CtpA/Prc
MRVFRFVFIGIVFLSSSISFAIERDEMQTHVGLLESVFSTSYAPLEWKKRHFNWDLQSKISSLRSQIDQRDEYTVDDFRNELRGFIMSTKDYHVAIRFFSTEAATLPLTIKSAQGRYFIAYIDREKASETAFPFQVGDELVKFDGQPVEDVIQMILTKSQMDNVPSTDRAIAELILTSRGGQRGYKVPKGLATLTIRPKGSEELKNWQLAWDYTPEIPQSLVNISDGLWREPINEQPTERLLETETPVRSTLPTELAEIELQAVKNNVLAKANMSANAFLDGLLAESNDEKPRPYQVGSKVSYLPPLGKVIWKNDSKKLFQAYIYQNEQGKLIGFLRIASYMPPGGNADNAVAELAEIISKFEELTDGLVIDEQNNPGGSVFYLYTLASMMSDQPLQVPRHRVAINQESIVQAITMLKQLENVSNDEEATKALGKTISGYPVNYQVIAQIRAYYNWMIEEWKQGKTLTDYNFFFAVDQITPYAKHYTKPVLVLTDELCFSGGDFFPTILQDNKVATIMGRRTAGAGGAVQTTVYPNQLGLQLFTYTFTLAERVDGNPIENLGVTPDVPYELTLEDRQNNYTDYVKAINEQMQKMVGAE